MGTLRERVRTWINGGIDVAKLQRKATQLEEEVTRARAVKRKGSGVEMSWGQFQYEKNSKLQGSSRWDEYRKMQNDPHIKASLRHAMLPLQKAEWSVEPASDSRRDAEIAAFVKANLLRMPDDEFGFGQEYYTRTSWTAQRLPEILDMLASGFAMFHKSTRAVNGKWIYDRLTWLEPHTVDPFEGWVMTDDDTLVEVQRTYDTPTEKFIYSEPIPAAEIMLYPWDLKGARLEGDPFIRSMYGAWVRKDYKQQMSAVWTQKRAAPMPYGFYPQGFPEEHIPAFITAVQAMRGTSPAESYFAGPMGNDNKPPEFGFADSDNDVDQGITRTIQAENMEIAHGGGTKSMALGETDSGSRALGETQGMLEMDLVEGIASIVCEFESHGVGNLRGLVEELVDWNFAGAKNYPKLVVSKVNPFHQEALFDKRLRAWEKRVIPHHPDARRQIVEELGLNLPDEVYEVEEPVIPPGLPSSPGGLPAGNGETPPGDATPGDDEAPTDVAAGVSLESADEFKKRIAPLLEPAREDAPKGAGFRGPTVLEATVVNLAAVSESFRVGERDTLTVLRAIRVGMQGDLMRRLANGKITTRTVGSQRASKPRGQKRYEAQLTAVFVEIGQAGADQVDEELARQDSAEEAA